LAVRYRLAGHRVNLASVTQLMLKKMRRRVIDKLVAHHLFALKGTKRHGLISVRVSQKAITRTAR